MPPEYISNGEITLKSDICSLGVIIIEIITGERMVQHDDIENVLENWKNGLQATLSRSALEAYLQQIRRCIAMALTCVKHSRRERPRIGEIINERETDIDCPEKDAGVSQKEKDTVTSAKLLLEIQPPELRFPFEPNKSIACPLHITNTTDHRIAFRVRPGNPDRYFTEWLCGVVPPGSRYTLTVTMKEHQKPQNPDKFLLDYSIIKDVNHLKNIKQGKTDFEFDKFFKEKTLDKVHNQELMVICDPQAQKTCEVISMVDFTKMVSMDVHPTSSWILTGHYDGHIYIWDYATKEKVFKEMVNSFVVDENKEVLTVKFIGRENWFVAGAADGYVFVYSYTTMMLVKRFKALEEKITSLAIHPTKPYVLSASYDFKIELLDWNNNWNPVGNFIEEHSDSVMQVVFNAKNAKYFASASEDKTVKIWSVDSPGSMRTLAGHTATVRCLEYFTSSGKQYLITGSDDGTAMIWDMENGTSVKTLKGHANRVFAVCSHPDRPILMTGSRDGTICIWSSRSFRLERTLNFGLRKVYALACVKGSSRVVIGHTSGLVVTDI